MSHAILSPSSASRWLACTPSARLEQSFPDTAGEAAAEGTLAHELGELLLSKYFDLVDEDTANAIEGSIQASKYYSPDLQSHAEDYAAFVIEQFEEARKETPDATILIEKKIDLTMYVPEGFGTGDAVIIADKVLYITDLKYGKGVKVNCEGNKQMRLYALGALHEFGFLYDIKAVCMTIYQPRLNNISSDVVKVNDLIKWGVDYLIPRVAMAWEGKGDYEPGDHCRFCKAKPQCKALADYQLELAKYEFKSAEILSDDEVSDILQRAESFVNWLKAIQDYAFDQALNFGKKWPGFKLVEGRSNRIYLDTEKVAARLLAEGYKEDVIYTKNLLGITAMEKAITKKNFDAILSSLVIKPAGKPTLVTEDDKRPEYNTASAAANDFKE